MRIIFLRHGTRDYGVGDRPLNCEGLEEAQELARDPKLQQATRLLASPKKRAQMTLEPLSQSLDKPITVVNQLDQHLPHESEAEFSQRVKSYVTSLESQIQSDETYILCSHSDWLAQAVSHIPTDELAVADHFFQCAEYMIFQVQDGLWIQQQ